MVSVYVGSAWKILPVTTRSLWSVLGGGGRESPVKHRAGGASTGGGGGGGRGGGDHHGSINNQVNKIKNKNHVVYGSSLLVN